MIERIYLIQCNYIRQSSKLYSPRLCYSHALIRFVFDENTSFLEVFLSKATVLFVFSSEIRFKFEVDHEIHLSSILRVLGSNGLGGKESDQMGRGMDARLLPQGEDRASSRQRIRGSPRANFLQSQGQPLNVSTIRRLSSVYIHVSTDFLLTFYMC